MVKIYFYDIGIRSSLAGNFNALHLRSDAGSLWENSMLMNSNGNPSHPVLGIPGFKAYPDRVDGSFQLMNTYIK